MNQAMSDDDFVRQFQSADIAHTDQLEAAKVAKRDALAMDQHIRAHAKAEVRHFEPIARGLIEAINAGSDRLVMMNAAGGFSIKCDAEMVTIYEAAPMYANVGVTNMIVAYMRIPGNMAMFGYGNPEPANRREERYVPGWDGESASILWHRDGRSSGLSTRALVQHALTTLRQRAD